MIFLYFPKPSPTALTWEEKNTGDYSYKHIDFTEMDKFFEQLEK